VLLVDTGVIVVATGRSDPPCWLREAVRGDRGFARHLTGGHNSSPIGARSSPALVPGRAGCRRRRRRGARGDHLPGRQRPAGDDFAAGWRVRSAGDDFGSPVTPCFSSPAGATRHRWTELVTAARW